MKPNRFLLMASMTLAMAFTNSYSSSGESYAAERGCRWNYKLQHGWIMGNDKQVRANAATEAHLNPNCAEVIWEARQMENGYRKSSGGSYAADRGCRWSYNLQHGGGFSEQTRANAMVESLSNPNCAEIIWEAKQMEKEGKSGQSKREVESYSKSSSSDQRIKSYVVTADNGESCNVVMRKSNDYSYYNPGYEFTLQCTKGTKIGCMRAYDSSKFILCAISGSVSTSSYGLLSANGYGNGTIYCSESKSISSISLHETTCN